MNWLLLFISTLVFASAPKERRVECYIPDDPEKRVYTFLEIEASEKKVWALRYQSKALKKETIDLELLNTSLVINEQNVDLSHTSPFGGVFVRFTLRGKQGLLEVSTNHGLEINDDRYAIPLEESIKTLGTAEALKLACDIKES